MASPSKKTQDITFLWVGKNSHGAKVNGVHTAKSSATVKAYLRQQGITPTKIRKKPKDLFSPRAPVIKASDIAIFSRMLATMMASGIPLMQALQIIGDGHENSSMKKMLLAIKDDVASGSYLSTALGQFPAHFDPLFVNLVHAGEQSGDLEGLLAEVANYKEKIEGLKKKVKKALMYPTIIFLFSILVSVFLLIKVIPQFEKIFQGFGADLPALTQLVIHASDFTRDYWLIIFVAISTTIFLFIKSLRRSARLQYWFDRILLRLPVIGAIVKKGAIARFARTFATMYRAGVPMVEAMNAVAGATGNRLYEVGTITMRDEVATGTRLYLAMTNSHLFPSLPIQMVSIGEESGQLEAMLAKTADFYEVEVDSAVDNMTTLIEPFVIILIGIIVGTMIIAMYLPIFKLGTVI